MKLYILRRLAQMVLTLLVITIVVFVLSRMTGDPLALMMPQDARPEDFAAIRQKLGLDKPVVVQYFMYLGGVARGDFGKSYKFGEPAAGLVLQRVPNTAQLTFSAILVGVLLGLPVGILSAVKRDSLFDRFGKAIALVGQAAPTFWVGIMLILFFSVRWRLLPTSGQGDWHHIILPAITLGIYPVAGIARLTRSAMLDVLDREFIKVVRIKGAPELNVILKHALRNAAIPVVTFLGVTVGALLSGTVVTETVFAWPGIGKLTVDAILFRDFPMVQAAVFVSALFFLLINFAVDIVYLYVDPRISYR
ncbi:MAG: ABC transporter permease [Chloroflexi bacterium]|nr:ABC transporter permease [Chloroflexota bacterium]